MGGEPEQRRLRVGRAMPSNGLRARGTRRSAGRQRATGEHGRRPLADAIVGFVASSLAPRA